MAYIEFLEGKKYAGKNPRFSENHEDFNDCGYMLEDDELVVDIDIDYEKGVNKNFTKESLKVLLETNGIYTQVVHTTRGYHLYFKRPENFNGANGKGNLSGLPVDLEYKHTKNTNRGLTIKQNGKMRIIENESVRQELPECLFDKKAVYEILPPAPVVMYDGDFDFNLFIDCVNRLKDIGYFDVGGNYDSWIKFILAICNMCQVGMVTEQQAMFVCTIIDCGDKSSFDKFERNKNETHNNPVTFHSIKKVMKKNGIHDIDKVCGSNSVVPYWEQSLKTNQFGELRPTQANFEVIMKNDEELKNVIAYNEFTGRVECIWKTPWSRVAMTQSWEDSDSQGLRVYMSRKYGVSSKDALEDVLSTVAYENKFHPVKEYFNSLPEWDRVERLKNLFIDYLGVDDNELIKEQTFLFFMAIINRVLEPGCKWDYTVVLLGGQGAGKSSFTRKITPSADWFTDSLETVEGKDTMQLLKGKLIVEMAEMSATSKKEAEKVKGFMTRQSDEYRASYGRHVINQPRQCVFIGTTNDEQFINDETGGRRWWVFKVTEKWFEKEKELGKINVDQLWSEAMVLYKEFKANGGQLKLTSELEEQAKEIQRQHMMLGTYEGDIAEALDSNACGWKVGVRICAKMVWDMVLGREQKDIKVSDIKRINTIIETHKDYVQVSGRTTVKGYGKGIAFEKVQ